MDSISQGVKAVNDDEKHDTDNDAELLDAVDKSDVKEVVRLLKSVKSGEKFDPDVLKLAFENAFEIGNSTIIKLMKINPIIMKLVDGPDEDHGGSPQVAPQVSTGHKTIDKDAKSDKHWWRKSWFGSKGKLSKDDMEFLKKHTTYDKAKIKEWYKGFKKDCPDGKLTQDNFRDMYKQMYPSGNAEEFSNHIFRTYDSDKSGYVDFKEFLLAMNMIAEGSPEEKLKWSFSVYDVDGNGFIDMQELTEIFQAVYDMKDSNSSKSPAERAEERAKVVFSKMDENNDGSLTEEEFLKGCLEDKEISDMLTPGN